MKLVHVIASCVCLGAWTSLKTKATVFAPRFVQIPIIPRSLLFKRRLMALQNSYNTHSFFIHIQQTFLKRILIFIYKSFIAVLNPPKSVTGKSKEGKSWLDARGGNLRRMTLVFKLFRKSRWAKKSVQFYKCSARLDTDHWAGHWSCGDIKCIDL